MGTKVVSAKKINGKNMRGWYPSRPCKKIQLMSAYVPQFFPGGGPTNNSGEGAGGGKSEI